MSFDADEEILQDFLVEAGEILEQLSEQLVELENRPDDITQGGIYMEKEQCGAGGQSIAYYIIPRRNSA